MGVSRESIEPEQTLIVLKPDAVQRGLIGEIIGRFERVGLKPVAAKIAQPDEAHYHQHYEEISRLGSRRGEETLRNTVAMMMQGPVLAMVLEGVGVVTQVRKMVGDTEPHSAAPGTIRGDFAHVSYQRADAAGVGVANLIHASGSGEEAVQEIGLWFQPHELCTSYAAVHEMHTQPR